jgi:anaerobic magnesium-protoporphyrin IX monomethyl ester cyclase
VIDVLLIEDLDQQKLPARLLAAVLAEAGLQAGIAHWAGADDNAAVVAQALATQPRLIVGSVLFAHGVRELLQLMATLRTAGVGAHLTMVGPLPTLAHRELLAACPALDSVLCGEAEVGIVALARAASEPALWPSVPGLACRTCAGECKSAASPAPLDLNALPHALRSGPPGHAERGFATVQGSRGCTQRCTFCLVAAERVPYRLRSVAGLVDEIAALHRRGARLFLFDDEQFLPPGEERRERVASLGKELAHRGLEIAFTIKCRADDVEEHLFRRLRGMGLLRAYVGIESGCQHTLDVYGKGATVAQNERALATLDRLGIVADFRVLLFHPWSTLADVRAEIAFLERLQPHVHIALDYREVEAYPGTPLVRRLGREGRLGDEGWPIAYSILDAQAEVLRRLCRFVFAPGGRYGQMRERLSREWFEVFGEAQGRSARLESLRHGRRAAGLRTCARHVNGEALAVWRDMLALAETDDILDAQIVHARAASWAARINGLDCLPHPAGRAPCAPVPPE